PLGKTLIAPRKLHSLRSCSQSALSGLGFGTRNYASRNSRDAEVLRPFFHSLSHPLDSQSWTVPARLSAKQLSSESSRSAALLSPSSRSLGGRVAQRGPTRSGYLYGMGRPPAEALPALFRSAAACRQLLPTLRRGPGISVSAVPT